MNNHNANTLSTDVSTIPKASLSKKIFSCLVGGVCFILGKYLGMGFVIFIIAVAFGVGFPNWYMKRAKVSYKFINIICWSNVVTWILPPIGIFTGLSTIGLRNRFNQPKKYIIFGILGTVIALFNAVIGGYQGFYNY